MRYYSAIDPDGNIGVIRYIIWSEVLLCPHCGKEISFFEKGTKRNPVKFEKDIICPQCKKKASVDEMKFQTPISYSTAFLDPHTGFTPNSSASSFIRSVGCSHSSAAIPVLPLPPKVSKTVSPGLVIDAIYTAIDSGEILVGYENVLKKAPLLADGIKM